MTKGTYDEVRYKLNKERAGEFKKNDYVTGLYEVGSSPENVENDLQSLIDEINDYKGNDYLTVVRISTLCLKIFTLFLLVMVE